MKAISVQNESLVWSRASVPEMGPAEVLVDVHATAVNRADLLQSKGLYPPPPGVSEVLGLECAGIVTAVGESVGNWQPGDRVCALLAGGGYAEQVAVPQGQLLPVPAGFSFAQAAALPEVMATVYLNLFHLAAAQPGERIVVHAGASGIGTAAIQLCKAFGNPCFVTVGSDEKVQQCVELGASAGFNRHSATDFSEAVLEWSEGRGADVILDPVGGAYLEYNQRCLAIDGRLVIIGLMGGLAAKLDLASLLSKRQQVVGSTLRARPLAEKAALVNNLHRHVWPLLESGQIKPVIETEMRVQNAEEAHELMASNKTVGKIVLNVR